MRQVLRPSLCHLHGSPEASDAPMSILQLPPVVVTHPEIAELLDRVCNFPSGLLLQLQQVARLLNPPLELGQAGGLRLDLLEEVPEQEAEAGPVQGGQQLLSTALQSGDKLSLMGLRQDQLREAQALHHSFGALEDRACCRSQGPLPWLSTASNILEALAREAVHVPVDADIGGPPALTGDRAVRPRCQHRLLLRPLRRDRLARGRVSGAPQPPQRHAAVCGTLELLSRSTAVRHFG
mmetsp:Transcript_28519/g.81668  ORF Transcript_28519/g.81668 Transcript_28519/m.81668 type:complete len:237 (-) Transcript_28519:52-762(-)